MDDKITAHPDEPQKPAGPDWLNIIIAIVFLLAIAGWLALQFIGQ